MTETTDHHAIVFDNGSNVFKAGFAGDIAPNFVESCIIGTPRFATQDRSVYVGDAAQRRRGILVLKCPIERGIITNWDDMEKIWHHAYSELGTTAENQPVLHTEPVLNYSANRERTTEVMFETFRVPAMYIYAHGLLSLYASGRTTGTVLDCGDGVSHAVSITEGQFVTNSIVRVDVSGRDLTDYLTQLLYNQHGILFSTAAEKEIVRDIKEKVCYITVNFDHEMRVSNSNIAKTYELPDNRIITVVNERFRCPEALFQPRLLGLDCAGIHEMIHNSIKKCDDSVRSSLLSNVVLSGGSTMFSGMKDRLLNELRELAPNNNVEVIATPERKYLGWIGGSIVASLSTFQTMWITKQEYNEFGSGIVHRKCTYT